MSLERVRKVEKARKGKNFNYLFFIHDLHQIGGVFFFEYEINKNCGCSGRPYSSGKNIYSYRVG